jgi:protein tyrosine phosphatase (PTP) superfamily phosphohydrolase (DUF442 family)
MKRIRTAVFLLAAFASCAAPEYPPVHRPGLDNAHWLTESVLSGAQPEGDAAFAALAALGVRTVISVDGGRPDAAAARRHGLRTVHLPIGYDGVPSGRAWELAKAILELPGPVYIHCHHGLHRSPAAAAVGCIVAGRMNNEQGIDAMKTLGTGPQYLGLWASARDARPAEASALRGLKVEFREAVPIPPLAEAMVGLDETFERLQLCAEAGWSRPAEHPDLDPAHEALRAREILTELLRADDVRSRSAEFRSLLEAARAGSERLESGLRGSGSADPAFAALKRSCADCHQSYRNVPTGK